MHEDPTSQAPDAAPESGGDVAAVPPAPRQRVGRAGGAPGGRRLRVEFRMESPVLNEHAAAALIRLLRRAAAALGDASVDRPAGVRPDPGQGPSAPEA